MSNDEKPKVPALRGEVLPPAIRRELPITRTPTGVIDAVFSGFFSRAAARAVADSNQLRIAQQRSIQIATDTAHDLRRLQSALAELDDIDAILAAEQRAREHGRSMAEHRRQVELRRADLEMQRLDMEQQQLDRQRRDMAMNDQRALQQADHQQRRDHLLHDEQLEKDRLALVMAESNRLHQEMLRDFMLRRSKGKASAEAIAAEAEELKAMQRFSELLGYHKPTEQQRDELADLMLEQVKEARNYAAGSSEAVQVLDRLAHSFSQLLKKK